MIRRPKLCIAADFRNALNQVFSRIILWMRFAGEDQLHRTRLVGQDAPQPFHIAKDQRCPLVRCEAPRESYGQRIGIEHLVGSFDLYLGRTAPDALIAHPIARPADDSLAPAFMSSPQFFGRNGVRAAPHFPVGRFFAPVRS